MYLTQSNPILGIPDQTLCSRPSVITVPMTGSARASGTRTDYSPRAPHAQVCRRRGRYFRWPYQPKVMARLCPLLDTELLGQKQPQQTDPRRHLRRAREIVRRTLVLSATDTKRSPPRDGERRH